jgi:hypothetical protein
VSVVRGILDVDAPGMVGDVELRDGTWPVPEVLMVGAVEVELTN